MIDAAAPVLAFDHIDSTNAEAQRRGEAGETGPVWLRAQMQSAGRGRRGRRWVSERGNLFTTYFATTSRPPADIALLGFAAALAVYDLAAQANAGSVAIKWPNDVLLDGAKCAGILLESGAATGGGTWFALGIGVNLVSAPDDLAYPVAALAGVEADPAFAILRARVGHWAGVYAAEGFGPLQAAWMARAHGLGAPVQASLAATTVEGLHAGLSERGELLLSLPDGREHLISAGEVFFPQSPGAI